MKRSELFFGAILLPIDFLALLLAGATAYGIRISPWVQQYRPAVFAVDLPLLEFIQLTSIVSIAIVVIFALQGLYAMEATRRLWDETTRIFSGVTLGMMLVIVTIFLSAELFQSRFILLMAYGLALIYVTGARYLVRRIQKGALRNGYGIHRVVIAGNGRYGDELKRIFAQRPELGYRVVGTLPVIRWDALENIYQRSGIDELIQTDPSLPEEDNLTLLDFSEQYKLEYKYIPNLFETHAPQVHYRQIGSVPLMELSRTPLDGWGRVAKRILDLIGAVVGLIVLSPFLAGVALFIKLDSRGPIFYKQTRIGRNMKPFDIYKFRSMKLQYCVGKEYGGKKAAEFEKTLRAKTNERTGPLFKMKDDPRRTRVGKVLRSFRIDELPQLFNVLVGDMSLIGPRPHLPQEVAQYDKYQRRLFTIKPGMSGMAQVAGSSGLDFDEEAKIDISYIENWKLLLDIVLLLKTFRILFTDRNAV